MSSSYRAMLNLTDHWLYYITGRKKQKPKAGYKSAVAALAFTRLCLVLTANMSRTLQNWRSRACK